MNLIERLEAASEGSRELDDEIATLLFTDKQRHCIKGLSDEAGGMWMFRYPNGSIGSSLRFTASLDAAMTLVSEGSIWMVTNTGTANPHEPEFGRATAIVGKWNAAMSDPVEAPTPALALCIAALRARGVS